MASQSNSDDENYRAAFGEHTGISSEGRDEINRIKDNDPDLKKISPRMCDVENFSDLAWELLGGYIANTII